MFLCALHKKTVVPSVGTEALVELIPHGHIDPDLDTPTIAQENSNSSALISLHTLVKPRETMRIHLIQDTPNTRTAGLSDYETTGLLFLNSPLKFVVELGSCRTYLFDPNLGEVDLTQT
jgi:hypothetical protein